MSLLPFIPRRLLRSHKDPLAFSFLKGISTGNFPRSFGSVISNLFDEVLPKQPGASNLFLVQNENRNRLTQLHFPHKLLCHNFIYLIIESLKTVYFNW